MNTTVAPEGITAIEIKRARAREVNQVVRIISNHGRRFFYHADSGRVGCMEVDSRGKVWWLDEYSCKRIYTHNSGFGGKWKGFTHGGTMRSLVECFRNYVCTGQPLNPDLLGLERTWGEGNIWGYDPESMEQVRYDAGALPVFKQMEKTDD